MIEIAISVLLITAAQTWVNLHLDRRIKAIEKLLKDDGDKR